MRNVAVPAVVGVPESAPVVAFNDNPAGRTSPVATENEGAGYPEAANVYEYAEPTNAAEGATLVNAGSSYTLKVMGSDVTVPAVFAATTRKVLVPAVVRMPESSLWRAARRAPPLRMSS